MKDRLQPLLSSVRTQYDQNARLRWGLLAIAVIALIYLFVTLVDVRTSIADSYVEKREKLWRMQAIAGQEFWLDRAVQAEAMRKRLASEIPVARTSGLAQAAVQTQSSAWADAVAGDMRVQVDAPVPVEGWDDLFRIPVTMSGGLQPAALIQLIRRVEGGDNLVTIEQANILNRQNKTVSLTLVFFYRVDPSAA